MRLIKHSCSTLKPFEKAPSIGAQDGQQQHLQVLQIFVPLHGEMPDRFKLSCTWVKCQKAGQHLPASFTSREPDNL